MYEAGNLVPRGPYQIVNSEEFFKKSFFLYREILDFLNSHPCLFIQLQIEISLALPYEILFSPQPQWKRQKEKLMFWCETSNNAF